MVQKSFDAIFFLIIIVTMGIGIGSYWMLYPHG